MSSEKEVNVYLFDILDILEDIAAVAETNDIEQVKKELEKQSRRIKRKLYQDPPLTSPNP